MGKLAFLVIFVPSCDKYALMKSLRHSPAALLLAITKQNQKLDLAQSRKEHEVLNLENAQSFNLNLFATDAYSGETVPLIPEQTGHPSERSDAGVFVLS